VFNSDITLNLGEGGSLAFMNATKRKKNLRPGQKLKPLRKTAKMGGKRNDLPFIVRRRGKEWIGLINLKKGGKKGPGGKKERGMTGNSLE